jgi:hypothetical protein
MARILGKSVVAGHLFKLGQFTFGTGDPCKAAQTRTSSSRGVKELVVAKKPYERDPNAEIEGWDVKISTVSRTPCAVPARGREYAIMYEI